MRSPFLFQKRFIKTIRQAWRVLVFERFRTGRGVPLTPCVHLGQFQVSDFSKQLLLLGYLIIFEIRRTATPQAQKTPPVAASPTNKQKETNHTHAATPFPLPQLRCHSYIRTERFPVRTKDAPVGIRPRFCGLTTHNEPQMSLWLLTPQHQQPKTTSPSIASTTTDSTTGAPFRLSCQCELQCELRQAQQSRRESTTISAGATRTESSHQPPLPPLPPPPHHRRRNRCPCCECCVRRELNTPGEYSIHEKAAVAVDASTNGITITCGGSPTIDSTNPSLHRRR